MTPKPKEEGTNGPSASGGLNGSTSCPFSKPENYPPVAPIPAIRKRSKSIVKQMSSGSDGLAVPPNLPSRCTWKPGVKNTYHTVDER